MAKKVKKTLVRMFEIAGQNWMEAMKYGLRM